MAQVYRGTDTVLGRTVAIKVLAPQYARDQGFVQRFRREAQAAARLNHPNVVSVYDTGSDPPVHYIVMEYVPGRTLGEVLKSEGRLQPERAAEVAAQVASALQFAHAAGIVHRDVKPANIMLTPQGEVKVMDFGIARAVSTETLTATATVLGTASYLSPEQAQGEPVDARSDIYSLGVVLYETLTGQVPFAADSPVAVAYKHVREPPTAPTEIVPDIPADLEAVVLKAMAKNPANRYSSASEMREDLERYLEGRPVLATPVLGPEAEETQLFTPTREGTAILTTPLPPEEGPRRRRVWIGVLVGVLIAAVVGLALFLLAKSLTGSSTETVEIPKVVGLNVEAAKLKLENAGLKAEEQLKASSKPEDQVINQKPDPGTEVETGSTVTLVVSAGRAQVTVPDVVGQTPEEAGVTLQDSKLQLGEKLADEPSDTVEKGSITRTRPEADASVTAGTPIDYFLSSGPQPVAVPDVHCMDFDQARRLLEDKGFNVTDGGTDPNGPDLNCPFPDRATRTVPSAGSEVPSGSDVTLYHSATPPSPSLSPSPSPSPEPSLSPSPSPSPLISTSL